MVRSDYVTTTEAAELLFCSHKTVVNLFDEGKLKGFRVGGKTHRRISIESIKKLVEENGIPIHPKLK